MKFYRSTSRRAFTMIEIAIALAVIGFALVAIIGVLPTGMNVQKDNRDETIINQDGPYFLEAIRSGARGLDVLLDYVDKVEVVLNDSGASGTKTITPVINNGSDIVGILSTPKSNLVSTAVYNGDVVRYVQAHVRALSGGATEQSGVGTNLSFSYLLQSEISPYQFFASETTNFARYATNTLDYIVRSNRWAETQGVSNNLYEVRLTLRWPLYGNGKVGNGRQTFRTLVPGTLAPEPNPNPNKLFFFRPQTFASQ
jgi:prepilin-type N-terminal cleavage/methylation domain-containing protein